MRSTLITALPPARDATTPPRVWSQTDLRLPPSLEHRVESQLDAGLSDAKDFLERLVEFPLSSWLAVGRTLIGERAALIVRQRARSEVDGVIDDRGLDVLAWYLRDALETTVWCASQRSDGWSREERREFAAAHGAAESTALALLTRPHLSAEAFGALYAPFAGSVTIRL